MKTAPLLRRACAALAALACMNAAQAGSGNPPVPPVDYDVEHYDLDIDVDFVAESIAGVVGITLRSLVASLTQVEVDLLDNMTVSQVTHGALPLTFSHSGDRVLIDLDQPLVLDDTLTVRISYSGMPAPGGVFVTEPFGFDTHGAGVPVVASFSEPWYARHWWPCKEDPADKATASMAVTVPSDMVAASNGLLVEVIDHGATKTYRWESAYPIANYLISVVITNFATFSDVYVPEAGGAMPLDYYAYPEHLAAATTAWAVTNDMLTFFRGYFGEYPFVDEKYGIAMWPGTGIEHQTLSFVGSCCFESTTLLAHELVHQWWGDLVTPATWRDIWLAEAFATWGECLWRGEEESNGYLSCLEGLDHPGSWVGPIYRGDISTVLSIFNAVVYGKGAWALHMLRGVLEDTVFFGALADYRAAFAFGNATTADFQSVVEAHAGQDLAWFFDEWIYDVGRPDYEYSWAADVPAAGLLTLTIEQVQSGAPVFKMPIDIDVLTTTGSERFVVWDSLVTQSFVLDPVGVPTGIGFDPENWILEDHTEVGVDVADADPGPRTGIEAIVPMPFSRSVALSLHVPEAEDVSLAVFDVAGRHVRTLLNAPEPIGANVVTWDGRGDSGRRMAPGVYFVRLEAGGITDVRRVVMVE